MILDIIQMVYKSVEYVHSRLKEHSFKCLFYFVFIEPNPVRNVGTSNKDTHTATVTWTAPSHHQGDNFDGYEYQLFDTTVIIPVQRENNLSPAITVVGFSNLTPGNTYRIEIKSFIYDGSNERLYGSVVSLEFTMSECIIIFLSLFSKFCRLIFFFFFFFFFFFLREGPLWTTTMANLLISTYSTEIYLHIVTIKRILHTHAH